jgi:hypothetical protein
MRPCGDVWQSDLCCQISWPTAERTVPDLACVTADGYSVNPWIDGKDCRGHGGARLAWTRGGLPRWTRRRKTSAKCTTFQEGAIPDAPDPEASPCSPSSPSVTAKQPRMTRTEHGLIPFKPDSGVSLTSVFAVALWRE